MHAKNPNSGSGESEKLFHENRARGAHGQPKTMEARGLLGKAAVSTESAVPPQPETDGGHASGGAGAQGGGGASSYSDDPETELRQIMRSSDFQKFCSLCQMQGQGDVFAICR